ncbi:MAG: hypothetical protein LC797_06905 [Chloroflexi bacterium]|nr:hypothetical protein [Chloroflexota bacterium]
MLARSFAIGLATVSLFCAACGSGPRAASADLVAIHQPTPDPTVDAVVRDLPRALAGVLAPTATATPPPPVALTVAPAPKPKQLAASPTMRAATAPVRVVRVESSATSVADPLEHTVRPATPAVRAPASTTTPGVPKPRP